MEVVYKKTIVEKMEVAIMKAMYKGKKIEKFILTRKEWEELHDKFIRSASSPKVSGEDTAPTSYYGIQVEVEC